LQIDPTIAAAQFDKAVELYQHEDNLTWKKVQQAVYVNGALATAVGMELIVELRWLTAVGGVCLAVLFLITIENSRRYMFTRLAEIRKAEQVLCVLGNVQPIIDEIRTSTWVPRTTFALRVFLWLAVVVWFLLACVWTWHAFV